MEKNTGIRIQKVLSDNGVLSRRKAEEAILAKRITVNGRPAVIGQRVNPAKDAIAVDGQRVFISKKKENVYILLNKPRGYVTTTSDELGRKCITQLVKDVPARVYPVGRLDKDSEGVILLTNDGDFANQVMHPRNEVPKTYRVTVDSAVTELQIIELSTKALGKGTVNAAQSVHVLEKTDNRSVLLITITEGKNRQIRNMCEAVGLNVIRLKRKSIGPLKIGMLKPGEYRMLKPAEILAMRNVLKRAHNRTNHN